MYLKRFSHQGIRNLNPGLLELAPRLNIFYGANGAGKSSILEALSLLTSGRSFRSSKLDLVLSHDSMSFTLFGLTSEEGRLGLGYQKSDKKKAIKIDGQACRTLSSLTRLYPTQVLSPESYHLIDSGPNERRKYLDWCLFHVEHRYHETWKSYYSVLKQRNALLKSASKLPSFELIDPWNRQLCKTAKLVAEYRDNILQCLTSSLNEILNKLSIDFGGEVVISHYLGHTGNLETKLNESLALDFKSGFTRYGPHKADLRIKVNGVLAKDFLSRGQKKVLINALFLAQTNLLKSLTTKDSLFVIDDFTSELDSDNQKALLATLLEQKNVQIILSCLQLESLNWLKKGYNTAHMFHVEHGEIKPIEPNETN